MSLIATETVCSWCKKHSDYMSSIVDGFRYPFAIMSVEGGGDDDDGDDVVYDYAPAAWYYKVEWTWVEKVNFKMFCINYIMS